MRGPGRDLPPTDPTKGAIDCPRPEPKADSSSDETQGCYGSRSGLGRRAQNGSSSSSSPPQAAPAPELPTVAEVLRMAKTFLQPTHAIERQFYADCYRACQVMPTTATRSTTVDPAATAATPSAAAAEGGGAGPPPPPPPQRLPYLSSVPEVALRLSCLGHRVVVRRVTDSRSYWSRSMANLFCYCVLPGTGIGYVLDPGFKEHFRAGRMSDRYRDIWECLPPLFVGPPAKLVQLVQALCTELQASFENSHRQLPPWRTFSCTINRWMSPVFRDLPVPLRRTVVAAAPQPPGGSGGSAAGMISAAEAQAFLRACAELMAGSASETPGGGATRAVAAAAAASGGEPRGGAASAHGPRPWPAAAATQGGISSGSGSSSGECTAEGEGRRAGAETSAGGRPSSPCPGEAAGMPMAAHADGATAAAAAGRVEVAGAAVAVSTAATAAASSTAWGPPQPAGRQPLRTIAGFELAPCVVPQSHTQPQARGVAAPAAAAAAAPVPTGAAAAAAAAAGSDTPAGPLPPPAAPAPTPLEPIRRSVLAASAGTAGAPLIGQIPSLSLTRRVAQPPRQQPTAVSTAAAAAAAAPASAAETGAGSRAGLLSRSLRSSPLVGLLPPPLPARQTQQ